MPDPADPAKPGASRRSIRTRPETNTSGRKNVSLNPCHPSQKRGDSEQYAHSISSRTAGHPERRVLTAHRWPGGEMGRRTARDRDFPGFGSVDRLARMTAGARLARAL